MTGSYFAWSVGIDSPYEIDFRILPTYIDGSPVINTASRLVQPADSEPGTLPAGVPAPKVVAALDLRQQGIVPFQEGTMVSCAAIVNRRRCRSPIGTQLAKLPHKGTSACGPGTSSNGRDPISGGPLLFRSKFWMKRKGPLCSFCCFKVACGIYIRLRKIEIGAEACASTPIPFN